jgi:predicted PurR-regulated permease PerM
LGLRVLTALFLAIVISSGLEVVVSYFERKGLPRALGVVSIFLLAVLLVLAVIYLVLPIILVDVVGALSGFSKLAAKAWWAPFLNFGTSDTLETIIAKVSQQIFSGTTSPFKTFSDLIGSVALAASVLVISFYLSLSKDGVERFIRALLPSSYEGPVLRVYTNAIRRIGIWFRTQILMSILMGVLALIALLILDVKYAFLVALLTAIFEIVPYVGPIVAGSAAVLAALITSPALALYTLIAFLVLHQIENHVIAPLLLGRNTGLHPVLVIAALLLGLEAGGFIGVVVSVPLAVIVQEIVEAWSSTRRQDSSITPSYV